MEKKKFMNGTEKGSKSEPATRRSSAPVGAATGFVELDDDSLASVSGGARCLTGMLAEPHPRKESNELLLLSHAVSFYLVFDSAHTVRSAEACLDDLREQNVDAQTILDYLNNSGLRPTNADEFRRDWG